MIFGKLSIFRGLGHLQLLKFWAAGRDCLLCGAACDGRACEACAASMPRTAFACVRCALPLDEAGLCGACLARAPAFDAALAAFAYRFPIDGVLRRFKFAGDLAAGRWLAEQLAETVSRAPRPDALVVPPLTAQGLRRRGFNQALEIARVVGAAHGIRVEPAAITKVRDTAPQPGLGARQRRANLRAAFRANRAWEGANVALVDDVMTTGATADAIARVLKAAGVRGVQVWAVARTPRPRR